jgi:tripartite-type tricarboxylate transporter receptor subunit TctC
MPVADPQTARPKNRGREEVMLDRSLRSLVRAAGIAATAIATVAVVLPAAHAQDYPSRTIKIIVPLPPGGAGDAGTRLIGQRLSERFGQPVVIENMPGASGSIGMNALKRAAPDGHTIGLAISTAHTADIVQNKKSTFDVVEDFTPITAMATNPAGMIVNAKISAASLSELIAFARARPGELSYGNSGLGTAHHLFGELLNKAAGVNVVGVPYRGVAPALNDLVGGHIPIAILPITPALPFIQKGQLRVLTVFDTLRYPRLPDVPMVAEEIPSFPPARPWLGFFGPARLSPAITVRLNEEIVRIITATEVRQFFSDNGLEVIANTPAEFATMLRAEAKVWDAAATAAGLIAAP